MTNAMMRTFILLAGLTALFGVIGLAIGGTSGMLIALAIAAAINLIGYWNSDKIVLRLYRAKPLADTQYMWLFTLIEDLARRAGIPTPAAYLIESNQPNAFATGRNPEHGAIAVTSALIERLSQREVAGVVAHELAHIKNRDTLIMTLTATIAGAISNLANFGLFFGNHNGNRHPIVSIMMAIIAPLAAMLVQMAISRNREYEADRVGAEISGDPEGLAMALATIHNRAQRIDNPAAENHPESAHLFIINPLHAHAIDGLFSTHPATQRRIDRLMAMAQSGQFIPANETLSASPVLDAPIRRRRSTFSRGE